MDSGLPLKYHKVVEYSVLGGDIQFDDVKWSENGLLYGKMNNEDGIKMQPPD